MTDVNPILKNYAEQLLTSKNGDSENGNADADQSTCSNTRVFVPLCGKTVDMAYLVTMSAEVVGVEGIRAALEQFANEQPDLKVEDKGCQDKFDRFEGNKISLLRGDYYDLDSTKTNGKFGAIYDRASMVAIQPDLRKSYVEVLGKLIAPRGKILLIALERKSKSEEAIKKGPPFSIPEDTVRDIYEGLDWVESVDLLEQSDQLEKKPEDKERYPDLDQLLEVVYMIRAK